MSDKTEKIMNDFESLSKIIVCCLNKPILFSLKIHRKER